MSIASKGAYIPEWYGDYVIYSAKGLERRYPIA